MPDHRDDELSLFLDVPEVLPAPTIRPWRSTPADDWARRAPSPAAFESQYWDLLRRNLAFMRALERCVGPMEAPEAQRFQDLHLALIQNLLQWREDVPSAAATLDPARRAIEVADALGKLRRRILEGMDPARQRAVLARESRTRISDREVGEVIALCELERAEERGEVLEIELNGPEPSTDVEFLGSGLVDTLVEAYMEQMRGEQESRPLPARGGLPALLAMIPVQWLDATWGALDLGPDRPSRRNERERQIARHLIEDQALRRIVGQRLKEKERRLLDFLLQRGGRASTAAVIGRFGSDRDDGWFWDEYPPTSALGRIRLYALAFVGVEKKAGRWTRTVCVPPELREPLRTTLLQAGMPGEPQGEHPISPPDWEAIKKAIESTFPDRLVEPIDDAWPLTDIHEELRSELGRLSGVSLLFERTLEGEEGSARGFANREEDEDSNEDLDAGWDDDDRSYALFFLSPSGKEFRVRIEGESSGENGRVRRTTGARHIGYAVAVSGVAPFSLLRMTSLDFDDESGTSIPDIETRYFDETWGPGSVEAYLRAQLGEAARALLDDLRDRIVRVLDEFGIGVLLEEDATRALSGFEADEGVLVGEALTVEDAFFFRYL